MGLGESKGATGAEGETHPAEHLLHGPDAQIVEQENSHGGISVAAGKLIWIGEIGHPVMQSSTLIGRKETSLLPGGCDHLG